MLLPNIDSDYLKIILVCSYILDKELLLKLLDSLFKQTKKISSIVIVDNHSTDGTSDELIQKGIIKQSVVGRCENSSR